MGVCIFNCEKKEGEIDINWQINNNMKNIEKINYHEYNRNKNEKSDCHKNKTSTEISLEEFDVNTENISNDISDDFYNQERYYNSMHINLREKVKSNFIIKKIFIYLEKTKKLNIIIYNKKYQNLLGFDIESYKNASEKYIETEGNGKVKEYKLNTKILLFEGGYFIINILILNLSHFMK